MKRVHLLGGLFAVLGLSGCIPTPIPRAYRYGYIVPEFSASVVDEATEAPVQNAKITLQYARCYVEDFCPPGRWASESNADAEMTLRKQMPEAWLRESQKVSRTATTTTDSGGRCSFDSHDGFTFFVIPLVPTAPVGEFYDPYVAPYRLVIEHPDYGVQTVRPADKVRLKKPNSQ